MEGRGKGLVLGPPKSRAGKRVGSLPSTVIPDLKDHLAEFTKTRPDALVFTVPSGVPVRRGNFNQVVSWRKAVKKVGVPNLHFHDLRHTDNTLAADAGVSTKNLMARMGHDSERAALIYQHVTAKGDRLIAAALDAQLRAERENTNSDDDGPDEGKAGLSVPAG